MVWLAPPPPPSPLKAACQQVLQPKLAQSATVENVVFDWESLHFVLKRGQLALAAPVNGRIITAVFTGTGELDVTPPDAIEKQQARFFTGHTAIAEPFTQAVFRFANGKLFIDALQDQVHFHPIDATSEFDALLASRAHNIERNGLDEGVRMLLAANADLDLPVAGRLLYAELKSTDHDWIEAVDDPMQAEPIRVHATTERAIYRLIGNAFVRGLDMMPPQSGLSMVGQVLATQPVSEGFDDTWTQFAQSGASAPVPPWRLSDYKLALNVPRRMLDYHLEGRQLAFTADATLTATWAPGTLVLLRLEPKLRVRAVSAAGVPVAWLQPDPPAPSPPDTDTAPDFGGNWLLLQLSHALTLGDHVALHFEYAPADANDIDYLAHAPLWYPQPALSAGAERTTFDFTAHSDISVRVTAAGDRIRNDRAGEMDTTEWVAKTPVPGFAFVLRPKAMNSAQPVVAPVSLSGGRTANVLQQEQKKALLELAANALRYFDATFGAYPFDTLDLTESAETRRWQTPEFQVPGTRGSRGTVRSSAAAAIDYRITMDVLGNLAEREINPTGAGMSRPGGRDEPAWPMLSEVNPLATWDDTLLHTLVRQGPKVAISPLAIERLLTFSPAQAIARQWFGIDIGAASPGDRWLSDGFSTAAALLFAQKADGDEAALRQARQWRIDLLGEDDYGEKPNDDGPLALGTRLSSSRDPLGYETVAFEKGAYVLYMLRQMMSNPSRAEPDDAFIAMMHEYTSTWSGRNPSTRDFIALANKYMTEDMDVDRNHTMNWFFDNYVYGTLVPHLWFHSTVTQAANGLVQVHLSIDNPDNWRGALPVYLMKPGGGFQRGWVPIHGAHVEIDSHVSFQPVDVVPNKFEDMLVEVSRSQAPYN